MKNITILGSTGSIGTSALDVVRALDDYNIVALSANRNYKLLIEQIIEFEPEYVSIGTEEGYEKIKEKFPNLKVFYGDEGLKELGKLDETDTILTAVSGSIGIESTLEAIKKEKRIALANKETMVAAGELINKMLKEYKAEIIPVDSEHSALFQALEGNASKEVKKLILTASGGPFRGRNREEVEDVGVEEALKHPNWSMGSKITIDSATLVNKGLEVIEANQLFGINYDNIEVLVHPQSIIHSMVEYCDSSIIAQLGLPDMKVPIQYAFTYPNRIPNYKLKGLDFVKKASTLTFELPNHTVFRGIELAFKAGKVGGTMPCVFNGANEVAVELFLEGKIKFLDIYKAIDRAMENHKVLEGDKLENIKEADRYSREYVRKHFGN